MHWRKYLPWLAALVLIFCVYKAFDLTSWRYEEEPLQRVEFWRQDVLRAEIRFPNLVFSGPRQAAIINRKLDEIHAAKTAAYAERLEQLLDEAEFNESMPKDTYGLYCYRDAGFSVAYLGKEYLSLQLYEYEHVENAPHPMVYRYAYVLDIDSGQQLTLEDIWGEGAKEKAAAQIYAQIESEGRVDDFYPGLQENLLTFLSDESWYLDATSIHIIYNPYDIGPYALGIVEFTLPK